MESFSATRSSIVSLENQVNSSLSKFSSFAVSCSSEPTSEEIKLENKISSNLNKIDQQLKQLARIYENESSTSSSAIKAQQLSRHKEILSENWKLFTNIKSSILTERNKINLLFNVQNDINSKKQQQTQEMDEMDYIQNESQRVNNLNNFADNLINRAFETRENLFGQRSQLNAASVRIVDSLEKIPGINFIISKINTRRKKDAVILASLITLCILILFFTS